MFLLSVHVYDSFVCLSNPPPPPDTVGHAQEPRPPERFLEMHRLAHLVKTIDKAVAVVPKGALLVEASKRAIGDSHRFEYNKRNKNHEKRRNLPPRNRKLEKDLHPLK